MVMRGDALTTARASRPRAPSAVKRGGRCSALMSIGCSLRLPVNSPLQVKKAFSVAKRTTNAKRFGIEIGLFLTYKKAIAL